MNLYPHHYAELKASGLSDETIERHFHSIEGGAAQEWLIEDSFDRLGAHSQQYATAPVQRLLEQSEHVKAGGWICSVNGQIKPDEPRKDADGKTIKYESKREKPYQGAHVSLMQPLAEPIKSAKGDRLVILTEGGKKAGAAATIGYETMPLPGVDMGFFGQDGDRALIPALAELAGQGCQFVIAFDQDAKKSKRRGVAGAVARTARLLIEAGCAVSVADWGYKSAKGLDDLLVAKGADFVHSAIAEALPFKQWKVKRPKSWFQVERPAGYAAELKRIEAMHAAYLARPNADVVLNQRYLDKGVLPAPGSVVLVDSPMSSGKTSSYLAGIVEQHRREYPDAAIISSAYRNILLRQSGLALGITHWLDTDGDPSLAKFKALSACGESLPKLASQKIPSGSLVLIDEIVAWMRHIFCSDTMKNGSDRVAVLRAVQTLFEKVLDGGGFIIGLESGIPQWAVDCLKELLPAGTPVSLTRNEFKMQANQKAFFYSDLAAFKAEQQAMVLKGVRVCAASDSATQIDRQYRPMFASIASFFISADNSADEDAQAFATDPQSFLLARMLVFFGYSPTIGAGSSIDDAPGREPFFDVVTGLFTHLPSGDAAQQLARYRRDVPMHIYCQEKGNGVGDRDLSVFDPVKLRARWHDEASYCHQLVNIAEYLSQASDEGLAATLARSLSGEIGDVALIDKWCSIATAIDNFDKLHLKKNLQAKLKADGYEVVEIECDKNPEKSQEFRELKEEAEIKSGEEFAALVVPDQMTPDEARTILSTHGHSRQESLQARKCLYQFEFPDCDFDNAAFCTEWLIKNRGKKLSQLRAEWAARNPEQAKAIDRWHLKGKLKQAKNLVTGVSMADVSQMSPAADLFAKAKLPEAIDAIGSQLYGNKHPEVIRVSDWAQKNKPLLKKILRMQFDEDRSNLDIFNSLARKLGYAPKAEKKKGKDGNREKVYVLSDFCNPDRGHMLKALTDKFVAKLEQKGEQMDGQPINEQPEWGVNAEVLKTRQAAVVVDDDGDEWEPISSVEAANEPDWEPISSVGPLSADDDEWAATLAKIKAVHERSLCNAA